MFITVREMKYLFDRFCVKGKDSLFVLFASYSFSYTNFVGNVSGWC